MGAEEGGGKQGEGDKGGEGAAYLSKAIFAFQHIQVRRMAVAGAALAYCAVLSERMRV